MLKFKQTFKGSLIAALFFALVGCLTVPVETSEPSRNKAAESFCARNPESVLC